MPSCGVGSAITTSFTIADGSQAALVCSSERAASASEGSAVLIQTGGVVTAIGARTGVFTRTPS